MSVCATGGRNVRDPDGRPGVGDPGRQVDAAHRLAHVPHRTVQHRVGGLAVRARHRLGKEHHVLVVEQVEVGVEPGGVRELDRTEPAPVTKVGGDGQRGPRAERSERDVRHHVQPQARDPGDPRVLHAAVVVPAFPALVRAQHHAFAAHPDRHAVLDDDLREPDAGDVAGGHDPGQQPQPAVPVAAGRRVEHPFGLELQRRVLAHDHPDPLETVGHRHPLTPDPRSLETKWRWNAMNSATAGAASTAAPARIAPYGLSAAAATVLM